MMFRIYLANALTEAVASIGQQVGLSGTVLAAVGFGGWGVEHTVIIEIGGASREQVGTLVAALFAAYPTEEAVYVVEDGVRGATWYRDGRVT